MTPDRPPSDAAKVERFALLLAGCQRQVFLYVMGLVHQASDAEEILQETNLVLWRKFDEFRPGAEFGRWACGVAHLEVLKFRERAMRHKKLFSDAFIEALATEGPASPQTLDARREALQGCLATLRPQDRQLILDRYQPHASTQTLAESLGRSVQGTRRALHRIRMALLGCVQRAMARGGQT